VPLGSPKCPSKDKTHSRDKPKGPPAAKPAAAPKRAGGPKAAPAPAAAPPAVAEAKVTEDEGPLAHCLPRQAFRKITSYVDAVLAKQAPTKGPTDPATGDMDIDADAAEPALPPVLSEQETGLLASIAAVEALPVAAPVALAELQAQLAKLRENQTKAAQAPRDLTLTIAQFECENLRYLDLHSKRHKTDMEAVAQKMRDAMLERDILLDTHAKALAHHAEQVAKTARLRERLAAEQLNTTAITPIQQLVQKQDRAAQLEEALLAKGFTKQQTETWPEEARAASEIALLLPSRAPPQALTLTTQPAAGSLLAVDVTVADEPEARIQRKRQADTIITKSATEAEMDDICANWEATSDEFGERALCAGLGILSQPVS